MNKETTTLAPDTAEGALSFTCPDWCVYPLDEDGLPDPEVHDLTVTDPGTDNRFTVVASHMGPTWGPFSGGAEIDVVSGRVLADVRFDDVAFDQEYRIGIANGDLAKLREFEGHVRAAREWLEAQHRNGGAVPA